MLVIGLSAVAAQVRVIEDETSRGTTILEFTTTTGEQVPIFESLGSIDITQDAGVVVNQLRQIASAPITLEVDNGFYTFRLYESNDFFTDYSFEIDAQGGTQQWQIRPGNRRRVGPAGVVGFFTLFVGVAGTAAGIIDTTSDIGDSNPVPAFIAGGAGFAVSATAWTIHLRNRPRAQLVGITAE